MNDNLRNNSGYFFDKEVSINLPLLVLDGETKLDNSTNIFKLLHRGNGTIIFPDSLTPSITYMLIIKQDTDTVYNIDWDNRIKWPDQSVPIISSGLGIKDVFCFVYDGEDLLGTVVNNY